jgi:hypothetical protein
VAGVDKQMPSFDKYGLKEKDATASGLQIRVEARPRCYLKHNFAGLEA